MIFLKTQEEIDLMAQGGRILGAVLQKLKAEVRPGMTTRELDAMAEKLIREAGAKPAFLRYRPYPGADPYPATLCASLNDTVVHGIPSGQMLKEGDVLKLDLGVLLKGYYTDAALTVAVGPVSENTEKLIKTTEEALQAGIRAAQPGSTLGDVGYAIQKLVEGRGFAVADLLTGHGIGKHLHEDPSVLNTGRRGGGEELVPGMVIAIEPMVITGYPKVKEMPDGSFVSKDGSTAAHFEHTVAITEKGNRILTLAA